MHESENLREEMLRQEPYLLTPGPLTTSYRTREAMLRDWGSRDDGFIALTAELRSRVIALTGDHDGAYDCVPMQGSGTFAVEAMLGSFVPVDGKVLVLANGAYGRRASAILARMGRSQTVLDTGDFLPARKAEVAAALAEDPEITHVFVVHCETSSGILNPLDEVAEAAREAGKGLLIDSMSAFGALPIDVREIGFDALVSSANKCLEGVPGFSLVIARKDCLAGAAGNCHSVSLDVHDQWSGLNRNGQWRFTPPTHTIAACVAALDAHEAEGGVAGRFRRYRDNLDVLLEGMLALGFETLLTRAWMAPIIVTFLCPADPAFSFGRFYRLLSKEGFLIYPGKLTRADSFRIGCIGQLDTEVMRQVVAAVGLALNRMGVADASPAPSALLERERLGPV